MKTRLPKQLSILLLASVLGVFTQSVFGETLTQDNIVTVDGVSYLDVGTGTATHTWNGDLNIGNDTEPQATGHVDKVGIFDADMNFRTPDGKTLFTNNLKVTGNVTVSGDGQILMGGQNGSNHQGLTATRLTVQGNDKVGTSVDITKGTFDELHIISGKVELTNTANCTGGNSYMGGAKQTSIKESIVLESGSLLMGYNNAQGIGGGSHRMNAFGAGGNFSIMQTGGSMKVQADSDMKAGFSITQKDNAGSMIFRDTIYMNGSGTNTIVQSADSAKLILGKITAVSNILSKPTNTFNFNQTGAGLIHLAYGTDFSATGKQSTINLNQSGGGTINIGGGHDVSLTGSLPGNFKISGFSSANTTYNLTQEDKGGTIALKSNADITADSVTQTGAGIIKLESGAKLNAGSVTQSGNAEINISANASLTANGITINGGRIINSGTINGVATLASGENTDTITITEGELVNSGTINAAINMTGGSLVAEEGSTIAGLTATGGDINVEGDITMSGDLVLDGDAELFFADAETTIDLGEYDTYFNGGSIALTLGDADISDVVLFTNASGTDYSGYAVTLKDADGNTTGSAVLEYNEDGSVTLAAAAVPEPTTTTLSLLALAALAARRRRK